VSAFYELIGRLYVAWLWRRYGRQLRIASVIAIAAVVAGGYLAATREPPEG
jgi:hypothetical protein